LDWTVAFTHEQPELGPYFSRAEWSRLDRAATTSSPPPG
jgi:hypothetical protein